jgi:hypothetical protein
MKMAEEKAAYEAKLQERRNSTSFTLRQEAEDAAPVLRKKEGNERLVHFEHRLSLFRHRYASKTKSRC